MRRRCSAARVRYLMNSANLLKKNLETPSIMVWYNSKEPGIRLGDDTSLGLSISCTKCAHAARIRLDVALRLWGERTRARDAAISAAHAAKQEPRPR